MEQKRGDISNLDFVSIKSNLIDFLNKQSEFSGYSFEGSAFNVLMDVLAYNTYYNAFYNNMVVNETFIDSASKRSSIVSLAKNLGYTPKSTRAATATINIKLDADNYTNDVINRNTQITATDTDNNTYTFVTTKSYSFDPVSFDSSGNVTQYGITDVPIIQGVYTSFSAIISDPKQKILLPFEGIDLSTIRAFVTTSISNQEGIENEWLRSTDITLTNSQSKVFFVQESATGNYEVTFGDNVFGKQLDKGNLVIFEFLVSAGAAANNIGSSDSAEYSSFSLSGYILETVQQSSGGSDREDLESVRVNALKNYSNEERAVTASDYESLILKNFNNVESIRCWGGEQNNPPQYGKVFASIKPINSASLTLPEKKQIVDSLVRNKSMLGISLEILDPDILYVNLFANVKYDPTTTRDSETKIKEVLNTKIRQYAVDNFKGFDDDFYTSDLVPQILTYHPSIVGASVGATMEKRIYPEAGKKQTYTVDFGNKIYHPKDCYDVSVVESSYFRIYVTENSQLVEKICYFNDDGGGKMRIYTLDTLGNKIYVNTNAGTIDYTTGIITIPDLTVSSFVNNQNYIYFITTPNDPDVFTDFDTILSFDATITRNVSITLTQVYKNSLNNASYATRNSANNTAG
jgi:hypothetical protein